MQEKLNNRENSIVKMILVITGIMTILMSLLNDALDKNEYKIYISMVVAVVSLFVLYKGKEKIFLTLLKHPKMVSITGKEKLDIIGNWVIHIKYHDDESRKDIQRIGHLLITNSLLGVKVVGTQLIDGNTLSNTDDRQVPVLEIWFADDAEVLKLDKDTLIYFYKIPHDVQRQKIVKVGYVITHRVDEQRFEGIFQDVSCDDNQIKRNGSIELVKHP